MAKAKKADKISLPDLPEFLEKKSKEIQKMVTRLERDTKRQLARSGSKLKKAAKSKHPLESIYAVFEKDLKQVAEKVMKDELIIRFKSGRKELELFIEKRIALAVRTLSQPRLTMLEDLKKNLQTINTELQRLSTAINKSKKGRVIRVVKKPASTPKKAVAKKSAKTTKKTAAKPVTVKVKARTTAVKSGRKAAPKTAVKKAAQKEKPVKARK